MRLHALSPWFVNLTWQAVREEALKASKVDVAALKKEVMDELEGMIKKEVKSAAPKSAPKQAPAGSADSWSSFIGT
jgi:hypothetical protein